MSQSAIITKLGELLTRGITSEAEAVYLLAEVRKLLEQQDAKKRYEYLKFHCDWALHAKLSGPTAQSILRLFDSASVRLKAGTGLNGLPDSLRTEIDRISKMNYFEQQLASFLRDNGLPPINAAHPQGWLNFEHLYARVVEDCPLTITAQNASATIASVTLQVLDASPMPHGEVWFKVNWITEFKNGGSGEIYVVSMFSTDDPGGSSETPPSPDATVPI